jgi:ParB family chromosome partitioning protein
MTKVPVSKIDLGPNASREEVGDCSELAVSIEAHGQQQPVVVRDGYGDRYILVSGFRRYHAIRYYLQWSEIDVRIEDNDCEDTTLNLVENLHRSNLSYWEEALALKKVFPLDTPLSEVARQLGKSRMWVRARLNLWLMDEKIILGVKEGRITSSQVAALMAGTPSANTTSLKAANKPAEKQIRAVVTLLLAEGRTDAATALTYALGDIPLEKLLPGH